MMIKFLLKNGGLRYFERTPQLTVDEAAGSRHANSWYFLCENTFSGLVEGKKCRTCINVGKIPYVILPLNQ